MCSFGFGLALYRGKKKIENYLVLISTLGKLFAIYGIVNSFSFSLLKLCNILNKIHKSEFRR